MKTLSAFGLVAILLFVTACNILPQGRWQGQQQQNRIEQLKKDLSLSDKQTTEIKNIFDKSREKMMSIRQDNMGDRSAMMKAFQENNEKTNSEIEKVLTPEQKKKFQKIFTKF